MKIAALPFDPPLFMAPMCDITNQPFRRICAEHGCAGLVTDMINARALCLSPTGRQWERMALHPTEGKVGVQFIGSEPEFMARAARMAEEAGAAFVDINMGCPVRKVVKTGGGAALMRDPGTAARIVAAMRRAINIPLTAKIRTGWNRNQQNAAEIGRICESEGVDAIFVHARTRTQMHRGEADWTVVAHLKEVLHIPVVGNGGIQTPQMAVQYLRDYGCDGVMVGQAACGNPWFFDQASAIMQGRVPAGPPVLEERVKVIIRHLDYFMESHPEKVVTLSFRKHIIWYTRGLRGSRELRSSLARMSSYETIRQRLQEFFASLMDQPPEGHEEALDRGRGAALDSRQVC